MKYRFKRLWDFVENFFLSSGMQARKLQIFGSGGFLFFVNQDITPEGVLIPVRGFDFTGPGISPFSIGAGHRHPRPGIQAPEGLPCFSAVRSQRQY